MANRDMDGRGGDGGAVSARHCREGERSAGDADVLRRLGCSVRSARKAACLTIAELARSVGVDPSYLGELERGRANVSILTLSALATRLAVSLPALVLSAAEAGVGRPAEEEDPPPDRDLSDARGAKGSDGTGTT